MVGRKIEVWDVDRRLPRSRGTVHGPTREPHGGTRKLLGPAINEVGTHDVGELNYTITRIVLHFLGQEPRYADFNAAIGALECAKLELYRRMVSPYEDRKIKENTDVYPDVA